MVQALKVAISLFSGLLTFLLPFLRGGEQELGVVGRAAVFFGIVPAVGVLLVFGTDWLKTKAPFWKLEDTPAGEKWVGAHAGDDVAAARWEKK